MNRISNHLLSLGRLSAAVRPALLLLALGIPTVVTACAADEEPISEPSEQSSEIVEIDKGHAQTEQTTQPVPTTDVTEHTSLVRSCETCGPLPDPWAKGPLPDPWVSTSSSSGTSTPMPHK